MKALVTNVNWSLSKEDFEGEVMLAINGRDYSAFSFNKDFKIGQQYDVKFECDVGDFKIEAAFSGNPERAKRLEKISKWKYRGYGQIVSVDPILCDFGDIQLNIGKWSNDATIIEKFVCVEIARLTVVA